MTVVSSNWRGRLVRGDVSGQPEAIGRSRGGLSTKIHLVVDGRGRPLSMLLTPGQASYKPQLLALMDAIRVIEPGPAGHASDRRS